jgi:hypothetical protein
MSKIVSTQAMNIVEASKREGYTDKASFLTQLAKKYDLLQVAPWFPSSDGAFHKYTQAVRLGNGGFVKANGPVPSISSSADTFIEAIASYQADSRVDDSILKTAKEPGKVRDSEDVANLEGVMKNWMYELFYGTNSIEGFKGFAERRAALDEQYTFDNGGSGSDLTSIWLMELGERGFNFRYPSGAQPGISSDDRGRHLVRTLADDGDFWAWIRHYEIYAGMEIKNPKALLRLANIESGGSTIDHAKFIKMKNQLPNVGRDAVGFGNRTAHAIVETMAYDKSNAAYSLQDIEGFGPVVRLVGIPIMMIETILDTESALTA